MFGDEIMVSSQVFDSRVTRMSLAVANDSGWYEVDYSMAENYFWGKGEGCAIFENTCQTASVSEFCSVEGHRGCSDNHMYRTVCSSNVFHPTCNVNLNIQNCKVQRNATTVQIDEDDNSVIFTYGMDSVCLNRDVRDIVIYLFVDS